MERTERQHPSRVLVAHVASTEDLLRAREHGWYRLRPSGAVDEIKGKLHRFRYLALYESYNAAPRPYQVQNYARIEAVELRLRSELLPEELDHPRAGLPYYVLRLGPVKQRRVPIVSRFNRDVRFLETNWDRFIAATEWNDLYYGSPLEERLYSGLRDWNLIAEREFRARCRDLDGGRTFFLDFALFCREGRLDIEADGDTYHLRRERILRDRERDKVLVSNRWNVLRFHTDEIRHNLHATLRRVANTVTAYGGVTSPARF